jgi:uncharacterized protein (DUF1501 family)
MNSINRRDFVLRLASAGLGVSVLPEIHAAQSVNKAEHIIYLFMNGGMSHLDTFDPKKDAEVKGKFNSINTNADYAISEHLPKLAKHGDKMAVIRSMMVNTGAHEQAQYLQRTSYKKIGTIIHPNMGAWMCKMQDKGEKISIPQNVLISGPADHPGAGWMAKKYSPIPIQDPLRGLENSKIKNKEEFSKRIEVLKQIERDAMKAANPSEKSYTEFYDQTVRLLNSSELDVFDLTKESADKREKYGNNRFGQGVCLAKRLIEQGGCKFIEVSDGGWDTHVNNFDALEEKLAVLDTALTALIEDLQASGLLKKTLIVITTDFGRTPIINVNDGRDHHPGAFSSALIGAGIKGGQVYGKSDDKGMKVLDGIVSPQDFNATIAAAAGLQTEQVLISPEGRPFKIADKGKPIPSLLA